MIASLIDERNNNNNVKDKQIKDLKIINYGIKQDQINQENRIETFRKDVSVVTKHYIINSFLIFIFDREIYFYF
jgi:hypothetical protein